MVQTMKCSTFYDQVYQNQISSFPKSNRPLRVCNRKMIFLFLNQNVCCGYSKELSQWDSSFEHQNHKLKVKGKKIFIILRWKILFISTYDPIMMSVQVWSKSTNPFRTDCRQEAMLTPIFQFLSRAFDDLENKDSIQFLPHPPLNEISVLV